MKKIIAMMLIALMSGTYVSAQLSKKTWMFGGDLNFTSANFTNSITTVNYHNSTVQLSPSVAYFVIPKLAVGLRMQYSDDRSKSQAGGVGATTINRTVNLNTGPFVRYYLLKERNKILNFLVEAGYGYGFLKTYTPFLQKHTTNRFSLLGGPVIFFTSTVGLEITVGYYKSYRSLHDVSTTGMQAGIGFQIHIGKEDNWRD